MRILVIGASGTIGSAVAGELDDRGHVVLGASRHTARYEVDIHDVESVRTLLERVRTVDALVCAAGNAVYEAPDAGDIGGFDATIQQSVSAQIQLVDEASRRVRDCIVLTAGMVAVESNGTVATAMTDGALERYVRKVALERRRPRINVVCPPLVHETVRRLGIAADIGVPAGRVAEMYRRAIERDLRGEVLTLE